MVRTKDMARLEMCQAYQPVDRSSCRAQLCQTSALALTALALMRQSCPTGKVKKLRLGSKSVKYIIRSPVGTTCPNLFMFFPNSPDQGVLDIEEKGL